MSAPKYLIDTNVFIGLEDWQEVSPEFAALTQLAAKHGVGVFVHEVARDDLERDPDLARRRVSLSKVAKFRVEIPSYCKGPRAHQNAVGSRVWQLPTS